MQCIKRSGYPWTDTPEIENSRQEGLPLFESRIQLNQWWPCQPESRTPWRLYQGPAWDVWLPKGLAFESLFGEYGQSLSLKAEVARSPREWLLHWAPFLPGLRERLLRTHRRLVSGFVKMELRAWLWWTNDRYVTDPSVDRFSNDILNLVWRDRLWLLFVGGVHLG